MYIKLFSVIGLLTSLFMLGRGLSVAHFARKSGEKLQIKLVSSILKSPLHWFDTTPSGQILGRTIKDQA